MKVLSTRLAIVLCALVGGYGSVSPVAADETGAAIYKAGLKSACYVYTPKYGSGSGSLIDVQKRLVITNDHVVGTADFVIVHFPMREKNGKLIVDKDKYMESITANKGIRGKVLAREETRDLAVIQLDRLPDGVTPVKLASGSPEAGDKIYSIGNPAASEAFWIYTPGEVRQVYDKKWTSSIGTDLTNHKAKVIEATSPVSAGDSGGPLFNSKGEQIGITQSVLSVGKAQAYSYFVDATEIKNFLVDRKITLSVSKEDPKTADPVTDPKTDPVTDPKIEPKKKDPPKVDPAAAEAEALEKKAATELGLLKSLTKDVNKRELAIEKLEALIKKYPKTNAAKEAKDLLRKLDK